jgi:competence protein ComEC
LIDRPFTYTIPTEKIKVDAIIITKNPKIYISQIVQRFDCPQIIFDAANSMWKINNWKKDCDSLHLRHHSVATEGAFIMDL